MTNLEFPQFLREMLRDNFGSTVLLAIVGAVALLFVAYLFLDFFRFKIGRYFHTRRQARRDAQFDSH